ncbi:MAG: PAS domain-containing sensor histidine kinase [Desulfobacteraceae bacterium IS3]|nr:MAG: PAS domain-containing sensor histidine kinase [Desulfobacteraceae bacterium IS3]
MNYIKTLSRSLGAKLILITGIILFLSISAWAYINIRYYKEKLIDGIISETDRFANTIRLGTHYAMMLNSRKDINQIINNTAKQEDIETIRIYNKDGQIRFSNIPSEIDQVTNIKTEACNACHYTDPPLSILDLNHRVRIFYAPDGKRLMGIVNPIYNERSCYSSSCHFHTADKKVLGALDVVVSMDDTDKEIFMLEKAIIILAMSVLIVTSAAIFLFVLKFVSKPIQGLIASARLIAIGDYTTTITINREDEIGELAKAFNQMKHEIFRKEVELNRQKDEYQTLFERVPCIITVQDRNYNLLNYNREFSKRFDPTPGDFCFFAYKGRMKKCRECPVEKTFEDGLCHYSEEKSVKDGKLTHWVVRTAPIKNAKGEIVAAMEISLDITRSKFLEDRLEKTEKKYYAIFNNIPNPVFVLDADSLQILDCNESVKSVYGYDKDELTMTSFLNLFKDQTVHNSLKLQTFSDTHQIRHVGKDGQILFVNIKISPLEYPEQKVLLVTTNDITRRLETEQQLIQAGKMATLGEMATGVAHELNQPLSVIKTASNFLMKKIRKKEQIREDILFTMAGEIDSHVDRAARIINHMREFGRKSDMRLEKIRIDDVLKKAFEFFSQQLKLREIQVDWNIAEAIPMIMGEADRLEQVFINLLINARDAIEEKCLTNQRNCDKKILFDIRVENDNVIVEISDTGVGIPKSLLEKIFEPFFTTKEVGKGTGLGLSISYGIVKDCGGNIRAVSGQGQGAAFIITFPVADKELWKTQFYL